MFNKIKTIRRWIKRKGVATDITGFLRQIYVRPYNLTKYVALNNLELHEVCHSITTRSETSRQILIAVEKPRLNIFMLLQFDHFRNEFWMM